MTKDIDRFYYKNNKLRQLQGFISVAKNGSITKAAEELGLTSPAVTKQIQTLEEQIKVKLFRKKGKGIELTPAGQKFYKMSLDRVNAIESLYDEFTTKNNRDDEGTLRIAGNAIILGHMMTYLPKIRNKNVCFTLFNIPQEEAIEKLLNNDLDIIFYNSDDIEIHGIKSIKWIHDPNCLMLPFDHELVDAVEISWQDLYRANLIRTSNRPERKEIAKLAAKDSFNDILHIVNPTQDLIKISSICNLGLSIYPKFAIDKSFIAKDISKLAGFYKCDIITAKDNKNKILSGDLIDLLLKKS